MAIVVGVRFKDRGKVYYFDPSELAIKQGDHVLVETVRGIEMGTVTMGPKEVAEDRLVTPLKRVLRVATPEDLVVEENNKKKVVEAMEIAKQKVADHGLEMHLVDAEYTFDGSRVVLYFTADGRVDFRELVKDLAGALHTRVELRQIGVRDQAKMIEGIGPCGRPLCCATFLNDFLPVSIKMAKDQNLSLNPTKISGTCGRLLCCLRFECDHYEDAKEGAKEETRDAAKEAELLTEDPGEQLTEEPLVEEGVEKEPPDGCQDPPKRG